MTEGTERRSAVIYQFPLRAKAACASGKGRLESDRAGPATLPPVVFGSGWYHDEAIQQAARDTASAEDRPPHAP
jgi:hypothetical protein